LVACSKAANLIPHIGPRWTLTPDGKEGEVKQFFFEKKNQKTFAMLVDVADTTGAH
jgi:hypothetical protein